LASRFAAYIEECGKGEIKPRLFAFALKTFLTLAKNAPNEALGDLKIVAPVLQEFAEVEDLELRMKKSKKAVVAVCGKQPFTIIQHIHDLVDVEEVEE